jgi:hypothetical protein
MDMQYRGMWSFIDAYPLLEEIYGKENGFIIRIAVSLIIPTEKGIREVVSSCSPSKQNST